MFRFPLPVVFFSASVSLCLSLFFLVFMLFFGVDMKQKGTGSQQAHFFSI
nr:MAG TPA: hypothetical protein [Caudoviricetes sp.]